jgi:hypothetical protein
VSDAKDNGPRKPLSSSGSHASGTKALSVSVADKQTPSASLSSPDDAAPSQSSSGEAQAQSEREFEAGATLSLEAEHLQPDAAGWDEAVAAPAGDASEETAVSDAIADLTTLPEFADQNPAEQSEPAAEPQSEDRDIPAPAGDQPLVTDVMGMASEAGEKAFAAVEETAHTAQDATAETMSAADLAASAYAVPNSSDQDPTSELRSVARKTIAENEAKQQQALALFDQVSRRFTAAMGEAGEDAARVTFKVMEFAQASLKNNLELAKGYSSARSVPDIFEMHTAYMKRQFELLNAQADELREITAKFALRNAASMKPQAKLADSSARRR